MDVDMYTLARTQRAAGRGNGSPRTGDTAELQTGVSEEDVVDRLRRSLEETRASLAEALRDVSMAVAAHEAGIVRYEAARADVERLQSVLSSERAARETAEAVLREVAGCFGAAMFEGWEQALAEGDLDRLRDVWNRRLSCAQQALAPWDVVGGEQS